MSAGAGRGAEWGLGRQFEGQRAWKERIWGRFGALKGAVEKSFSIRVQGRAKEGGLLGKNSG